MPGSALLCFLILLVWFQTNGIPMYLEMVLSRLRKFFPGFDPIRTEEYFAFKSEGYPGNYVDFLTEHYSSVWIVGLLKCEVCVSVWLLGIQLLLSCSLERAATAAAGGLLIYRLLLRLER